MINKLKPNSYFVFILYYALIYMALSAYLPFIGVYYLNLGYSIGQIGLFTAIGPFISIVVQPFWGMASDRARYREKVLKVSIAGTIVMALLYPLNSSFAYVFIVTAAYMSFSSATIPLSDAITLGYIKKAGYRFAPIRLAGTVGFAVTVLLTGNMVREHISYIFYINAAFLLMTLLSTYMMPVEKKRDSIRVKVDMRKIFKNRAIMFLLIYSLVMQMALSFYGAFVGVFIKNINGTNFHVGLAMCISALSEVPVLLIIDKAIKKFGSLSILLFSGIMTGIRMLLLYIAGNMEIIMVSQLLQGVTFITVYYCSVVMINDEMPDNLKSTGQSILALVRMGVASIIGIIGGGYLSEIVGMGTVFLLMFCVVTLFTIGFIIFFGFRRMKNKSIKG